MANQEKLGAARGCGVILLAVVILVAISAAGCVHHGPAKLAIAFNLGNQNETIETYTQPLPDGHWRHGATDAHRVCPGTTRGHLSTFDLCTCQSHTTKHTGDAPGQCANPSLLRAK